MGCEKNIPQAPTFLSYFIKHDLWSNLKTLGDLFFATNAKMVLINDDQCGIADIVLDVWLFEKKLNHPSVHYLQSLNKCIWKKEIVKESFFHT